MNPVPEKIKTSAGMETVADTVKRAKAMVQPMVSADKLMNPIAPVTVPEPRLPSLPSNTLNIARNVSRDTDGFISAQTEEAKRLKDLQATYGALSNDSSLTDVFNNKMAESGITSDSFKELKDIQLQLTDMDTKSGLNKVTIESGGQGAIQGQRSLTQEDREAAVRSAGLASRAAVLQGNIQTATALAKDAVNIAYQDRTLKATNLLNQIEMVQGQVDDQTAQLLEQEKRGYEAELASIKEVKDAVSTAMVNGATQTEISQLTDPTIDDATKLSLAQSITARGANEMRSLEMGAKSASIRASNASAALNEAELVAFNKAQEDAAKGILTTEQMGTANDLNKDFESQPIVKAYNEGLQKYIVLEDTLANGIDGVQDLQLVYDFMKSVDPTSVVRETEFANAAKTGNIFQGAYSGFNKAFGTGGFLPEEVKNDFIRAARTSFEAKNDQYFNVKSEYANRMNRTIGVNNGADYLTAYEGAAPLTQVDFDLADTLSNASPEEIADIMMRTEGLVGTNIYK